MVEVVRRFHLLLRLVANDILGEPYDRSGRWLLRPRSRGGGERISHSALFSLHIA